MTSPIKTSNTDKTLRTGSQACNLSLDKLANYIKAHEATYSCRATFTANGSYVLVETRDRDYTSLFSLQEGSNRLEPLYDGRAGDPQLFANGMVYMAQRDRSNVMQIDQDLNVTEAYSLSTDNTILTGSLTQRVYRPQPEAASPLYTVYSRVVGQKEYELKDHLGNVRTLVGDTKTATTEAGQTTYYTGIMAYYNYYPFGSLQPGRFNPSNTVGQNGYRYGFNGKEKDDDVNGTGVTYDYGFRIYDARIARFLSVDPLTKDFPMLSTYQYASNTPIMAIDLDGLEAVTYQYEFRVIGGAEISVTTSHSIGLAIDKQLNYGFYYTGTFGGGLGAGLLTGWSLSGFPSAKSINDLAKWGGAVGGFSSPVPGTAIPFKPIGGEFNQTFNDEGFGPSGGTVSGRLNPLSLKLGNYGGGIGVYAEASYTYFFHKGNLKDIGNSAFEESLRKIGWTKEEFNIKTNEILKYLEKIEYQNKSLTIDDMLEKGWTVPIQDVERNNQMKKNATELNKFFNQESSEPNQ